MFCEGIFISKLSGISQKGKPYYTALVRESEGVQLQYRLFVSEDVYNKLEKMGQKITIQSDVSFNGSGTLTVVI